MPVRKQPSEDGGRYCRPVLQLKQGIVLLTYQQQESRWTGYALCSAFVRWRGAGSISGAGQSALL